MNVKELVSDVGVGMIGGYVGTQISAAHSAHSGTGVVQARIGHPAPQARALRTDGLGGSPGAGGRVHSLLLVVGPERGCIALTKPPRARTQRSRYI